MKKSIARFLAINITRSAKESSKNQKSIVGAMPVPKELKERKGE